MLKYRIKMRHIHAVGIGILLMLLVLVGTGSADPSQGTDCISCHSFDGSIFLNTHLFDGISAPTVYSSCTKCHNAEESASLTSTGSFYSSTNRYNATTLASEILAAPGCGICHVDVVGNNFNLLTGTPTYLTSKTCQACHKAKYDNWSNTLHAVMLTPKVKAQAMNLPIPPVGWANISYVIVTKFAFAYINNTGYFPAQNDTYNTETQEFENGHAGAAYGTCGRCHTTNWNASARNSSLPGFNGTFSEPGIACERCHKPAGNGHQVVINFSGSLCTECHSGGNHGTGWENGEHAPPPYENGTNCMFCHSSFDQYKNQGATIANATGVSCGVCHNIHDMTDSKYAATFSNGVFNPTTWSEVADSKLAFFNATASIAAGTDIFDDLSNRLLYPGTDANRKDSSYGTAPINLTGRPVSDVLCSMCHFRHGLAHMANVSLSHGTYYYGKEAGASCIDCHMQGASATVGKDQMKLHANDPLADVNKSCGSTTGCHTSSVQNLSASSHSVVPVQREWKASAHNDKEVTVSAAGGANHFFGTINTTTGIANSQLNSCLKCKDPINWNPSIADSNTTYKVNLTDSFKGITCTVCHNLHDMGDWLAETKAAFGVQKPYAWYNRDAILTGTRYKANYTMMANTIELCGNCHSNIRYGNTGPGWAINATNPTSVHGYPAKDIFVDSVKQKMLNPATNATFECIDCHMATKITDSSGSILPDSQKVKGHSFKVNTSILMGTNCSNCHITGSSLGNMSTTIEKIQVETHDKWNATNITVLSALATIKAYSGEKNLSRNLIAEAYWNLKLVSSDESWGVHNPNGTNKLLENATALANESLAKLGEASCSPSFIDVPCDFWGYQYVEYLKNHSVTLGYPDGTFRPNNQISRAEMATFMVKARNLTYTGGLTNFTDVPSTHWAYNYIMAAKQAGIIGGYPDGTFKPENMVTRAEISVMVSRAGNFTYSGGLTNFSDVPSTYWGYQYIMAVKQYGIVSGYPDGTFKPDNQATRAEASVMVTKLMMTFDITPPASISALTNSSYANTYINWTWADPEDADFARVQVFIDGIRGPDVLKGQRFYNATGFRFGTRHNISTHTVDTNGNINSSWKNHSATTDWQRQVCDPSFTDVICSDWYYPYTEYLLNHEITFGYPDGTYRPVNNISRAELVSFIVNATNKTYTGGLANFSDVPPTHWAYQYVIAAVQAGIVSGYPDGTFRPDNSSKRAETSVMISKAWNLTYTGGLPNYSDVSPSYWGYSYIMALKQYGIVSGGTGAFRPDDPTTRAEASVMVTKATLLP